MTLYFDAMPSFGPLLRRTREERGVSLETISGETRLSKRYLLALEDEAIAKLPGGTYNRAYLRTYATFLGLEPEALLRDYMSEEERQASASQRDLLATMNRAVDQRQAPSTDGVFARVAGRPLGPIFAVAGLVVLALAVVAGFAWYGMGGIGSDTKPVARRSADPPPAVATVPAPPRTVSTPPTKARSVAPAPAPASAAAPAVAAGRPAARPSGDRTAPSDVADHSSVADAQQASEQVELSHLSITGSGVGTGVVDRELVGQSDRFAVGSRVVFWTHVVGGRDGDTIDHVWFRDGSLVGAASLSVGGADWRTQSRRVLGPSGDWVVEARDADGRVLARHEFRASAQ